MLRDMDLAPGTYRVGFFNTREQREDETELDAESGWDLELLFADFCRENNCAPDRVLYVERAA